MPSNTKRDTQQHRILWRRRMAPKTKIWMLMSVLTARHTGARTQKYERTFNKTAQLFSQIFQPYLDNDMLLTLATKFLLLPPFIRKKRKLHQHQEVSRNILAYKLRLNSQCQPVPSRYRKVSRNRGVSMEDDQHGEWFELDGGGSSVVPADLWPGSTDTSSSIFMTSMTSPFCSTSSSSSSWDPREKKMVDLDQDAPPSQFHLFFLGAKPDLDEILILLRRPGSPLSVPRIT